MKSVLAKIKESTCAVRALMGQDLYSLMWTPRNKAINFQSSNF